MTGQGVALLLLLALAAGCSGEAAARPEWLVTVSTDAPVPQLGDRLLVETLTADGQLACDDCRRVLSAATPEDFPVSFSVVPNGELLMLRTRLYRSQVVADDGLPRTSFVIDRIGILPQTDTLRALSVQLSLGCFGVPMDLPSARGCSPQTGELGPIGELDSLPALVAGSSPFATRRECSGSEPEGMRCIPGGLFVLGNDAALLITPELDARPEHVTQLSPFYLDEDEMSVGQIRELIADGRLSSVPTIRSDRTVRATGCTYLGEASAANDAYPVNCISRELAAEACAALGKRLPTEAEWEYAAGNTSRETPFPWGSDANVCRYCAVARAGLALQTETLTVVDNTCIGESNAGPLAAPLPGGEPRDVTDQGIRNLAGNVAELVADAAAPFSSTCWAGAGILEDPRCDLPASERFPFVVRGGSWSGLTLFAAVTTRNASGVGLPLDPEVGFRCARSAE